MSMKISILRLTLATIATMAELCRADVPVSCIKPQLSTTTGVERGEEVSLDEDVSQLADKDTHFFGLRACSEKVTVVNEETGETTEEKGRLVSVQLYLKNDKTDELIAMDPVGPTLDEDAVICVKKKLEFGHYFVD